MLMEVYVMGKRMTWGEICKEYPNQQVGITDFTMSDDGGVIDGIVAYSEQDGYPRKKIAGITLASNTKKAGTMVCRYTGKIGSFVGIAEVV